MITQTALLSNQDACARANIYGFLAAVFSSHPSEASVESVREMATALDIAWDDHRSLDELDAEYMALFVVPGRRYVAPYESVFRDRWQVPAALRPGSNPSEASITIKGLLMGESTLAVRDCYRRVGVSPTEALPDHIANELRFIAHLWSCEAETVGDDAVRHAELRVEFCTQHLLKWLRQLRERVLESGHRGCYTIALELAERVLEDEYQTSQVSQDL